MRLDCVINCLELLKTAVRCANHCIPSQLSSGEDGMKVGTKHMHMGMRFHYFFGVNVSF